MDAGCSAELVSRPFLFASSNCDEPSFLDGWQCICKLALDVVSAYRHLWKIQAALELLLTGHTLRTDGRKLSSKSTAGHVNDALITIDQVYDEHMDMSIEGSPKPSRNGYFWRKKPASYGGSIQIKSLLVRKGQQRREHRDNFMKTKKIAILK